MAKDQENGAEVDNSERPKCFNSTFQEVLFVLTATMAIGQQSFFQGCIVGVTASIGKDLHMNAAEITWINAGASLTSGAFLLTFGKLADMFGRKILFTIGMAGFTFSLLIAGFATNAIYMDVFSGILGLFAAAVVPPAVGALGATYEKPSKRKNLAFACFSAGNPLGFVGGMIISGVAAHLYNWRASFWALAVVYAIFTVLTVWTVPADGFDRTPLSVNALKQFDILGMVLVVVGFAFFSSSLSLAADAPDGWKTGYVLALFIVGFFLLVAFLYWQSVATHPLMPLWVWRDRNFSLLIGTCCIGFMGFSAVSFFLSLYLQNLKHLSALEITVRLLPMVISGVLVNVVCGLVLHRVSNKILTGIGALAYTASFLILSFMTQEASYWAFIFPALVLVVVGADIQFNVTNMYVMSTLPPSQQSIAGGIFNTVNKLCSNLGLGIATSVQSAVVLRMTASTPAIRPYLSVYWFAAAASGVSLISVPFLTIGKQGNDVPQDVRLIPGEGTGEEVGEKPTVTAKANSVISSAVDITENEKR
ncbi:Major facilitator superfamily domain general substrate transporter [Penicillium fimorum]|uniref:Major facilitator superfamily domain general substrate transporter n=1 Tax=Penicillium fimorum TaxID=1882269 RepID=A0A9W9XWH1_9EURO|nr:Major facilitator superfamily domain general substrate transporter [Penicillium fimorum]